MSIKVWEAYRVKKGHNIWEVMRDIRLIAEKRARKTLTKLYDQFLKDWNNDPKMKLAAAKLIYRDEKRAKESAKEKWSYAQAHDFVYRQYAAQRATSERNPFDLDVCVAVRQLRGRFYLIPYPGSGFLGATLRFLAKHPALEDYHYQNQTDRPENISAREWARRSKIWDVLLDDDRWPDKLALDIVSVDGFVRVDPWMKLLIDGMRRRRKGQFTRPKKPAVLKPAVFMLNEQHTTHVTKAQARKERRAKKATEQQ